MDYRFDNKENWWPWLKSDDVHIPVDATLAEIIINTKESGYINNWLDMCFSISSPILFIGPTGTGKTATIMNYLKGLPKEEYLSNVVNCSARTTAQQMQELVMSKLDRRRKGVFGPPVGKRVNRKFSFFCFCGV